MIRVDLARVHPLGSYHVVDLEFAADEAHVRETVAHVREVRVHVNTA